MKAIPGKIRAELFLDLLRATHPELEIDVAFESKFKRNYEQDIINLKEVLKKISEDDPGKITMKLSRDGLYKSLPEGLFHDCNRFSKNRKLDSDAYANELRKQQEEVAHAKKLFTPFDNYLFRQQLQYEQNINEILNRDIYSITKSIILNYDFPEDNNPYMQRCIAFVPFINRLKGNSTRLANVLGYIFRTQVRIKKDTEYRLVKIPRGFNNSNLGRAKLSESFTVGKEFADTFYSWKILATAEGNVFDELVKNKEMIDRFIVFFSNYFISKDIEVTFKIRAHQPVKFSLGKANKKQAILGCNIRI